MQRSSTVPQALHTTIVIAASVLVHTLPPPEQQYLRVRRVHNTAICSFTKSFNTLLQLVANQAIKRMRMARADVYASSQCVPEMIIDLSGQNAGKDASVKLWYHHP
jgi:hypothetical protein